MINPVMIKLFQVEMELYQSFLNSFNSHKDIKERLLGMNQKYINRKQVYYDPLKYIANKHPHLGADHNYHRMKSHSSSDVVSDLQGGLKSSSSPKSRFKQIETKLDQQQQQSPQQRSPTQVSPISSLNSSQINKFKEYSSPIIDQNEFSKITNVFSTDGQDFRSN
jgi:hypothetical protein